MTVGPLTSARSANLDTVTHPADGYAVKIASATRRSALGSPGNAERIRSATKDMKQMLPKFGLTGHTEGGLDEVPHRRKNLVTELGRGKGPVKGTCCD